MQEILSICIVVYKTYRDVIECIKLIEKHTDKRILKKIYIVDNSPIGTEGTADFKQFVELYSDIVYIESGENLGFGRGHNKVIPLIDSKYHAIVNPDILLDRDAFSSIISYMNDSDDVGMVIPRIVDENGVLQKVYREELTVLDMFIRMFCNGHFKSRQDKHTLQYKDYTKVFQVPFGQGSFLVIRTDLFKELNGFDDGYFMYLEDADLCRRVNQNSKLVYYPDAQVIHKWEQGSHKNKTLFKYHVNSMIYYFRKWGLRLF